MCGIVGIVAKSYVNQEIYDALTFLQHRGQDAAGIVTCQDGRFFLRKDNGLVRDVFRTRHMRRLVGNMGIGHVRYPTAGSSSAAESQPFYVNSPYGIALAHNGNLTNAAELAESIFKADLRHINTNSDSEVLLNVFAHELQRLGQLVPTEEDIFYAVRQVHRRCVGGYAVIAMITDIGIVGMRDPFGIRPLCYGKRESEHGAEYMVASESVALDAAGYTMVRDLAPGECIYITETGHVFTRQCAENAVLSPCLFEFVYLARPDSVMDGISVYKARLKMGEYLADQILRDWPDHDIDVVIPIPDTSRTSAVELASKLGVKLREGYIKNRYIGRTFIMPGQTQRQKSVRQKLNPIELEFRGKNVLLVDDSIVRGTTSTLIIEMAREMGAKKVYFASAAPAVRFPNVYGIDMPSVDELVAYGRTDAEVGEVIGADRMIYQDLADLVRSTQGGGSDIANFDCSVFDGNYVTGDVDDAYLANLEAARNDQSMHNVNVIDDDVSLATNMQSKL
ncbi:amidophosphoribosyltransferase [Candidatus Njordibacter sp. Uisw_039]|jgi:amidophosphoribosyltransferase|uniref:amidophosphoribosyltransferase n=1 Tax=Candidatus Njordibacter sp. Uisw_039 TaxID=3230972 RepID=UPI003A2219C8|tara:strand:+ start:23714 stop:25234 length:1521 start_codon:yes stop_codon:yes gene_type:complete